MYPASVKFVVRRTGVPLPSLLSSPHSPPCGLSNTSESDSIGYFASHKNISINCDLTSTSVFAKSFLYAFLVLIAAQIIGVNLFCSSIVGILNSNSFKSFQFIVGESEPTDIRIASSKK